MSKTVHRFRLYPTKEQEIQMSEWIETCRRLWNDALSGRKERWKKDRKSTSYNTQAGELPLLRKTDPFLGNIYAQVSQDILRRLEKAFKSFFSGTSKYPKFKFYRESGSFTYPQAYRGSVKLGVSGKKIFLSKIGYVTIVAHREVPKDGTLKTCTIKREPDGKWYAVLMYETEDILPPVPTTFLSPTGIDLGLTPIIATSDGEKIDPPRFYRKAENRLKHLQREMSRKKRGSKNRNKVRLKVARQASHIANQREDFNHKVSEKIVREYDLIVVGNLEVGNLARRHTTAKSFYDAGLGQLVRFIEYKAAKYGKRLIFVPEQFTTQDCNSCKIRNSIEEGIMEFVCVGCGNTTDRQVNAARNILARGYSMVGKDIPEPIGLSEKRPLPEQSIASASIFGEAGTVLKAQ